LEAAPVVGFGTAEGRIGGRWCEKEAFIRLKDEGTYHHREISTNWFCHMSVTALKAQGNILSVGNSLCRK